MRRVRREDEHVLFAVARGHEERYGRRHGRLSDATFASDENEPHTRWGHRVEPTRRTSLRDRAGGPRRARTRGGLRGARCGDSFGKSKERRCAAWLLVHGRGDGHKAPLAE